MEAQQSGTQAGHKALYTISEVLLALAASHWRQAAAAATTASRVHVNEPNERAALAKLGWRACRSRSRGACWVIHMKEAFALVEARQHDVVTATGELARVWGAFCSNVRNQRVAPARCQSLGLFDVRKALALEAVVCSHRTFCYLADTVAGRSIRSRRKIAVPGVDEELGDHWRLDRGEISSGRAGQEGQDHGARCDAAATGTNVIGI